MGYEYIEHTADLGIRVTAEDLASLYAEAGIALADVMGARDAGGSASMDVTVEGIDPVDLLVRWLQELLFLIDVRGLRIGRIEIRELTGNVLKAWAYGTCSAAPLSREIKAVTYHNLEIRHIDNTFEAAIIFDM